jgi:hypothetical protein
VVLDLGMTATLSPKAIARTFFPTRKANFGFRRIFAQAGNSCIPAACICSFAESSNQPENVRARLLERELLFPL